MNSKVKPASESRVVKTELVLPSHTNTHGTIFGGTIMSWIDIAGAISAQRHSQRPVVTASIDDLHFIAPVKEGWVVNMIASVNFTGKSSMEVGVRVDAENPITGETFHTASAYLTFVALDDHGNPAEVIQVVPESEDEKRRYQGAIERRKLRLARRQTMRQKN